MLPNLAEFTSSISAGGPQAASPRRQENERVLEAYRVAQESQEKQAKEEGALRQREVESEAVAVAADVEKKAAERAEKKSATEVRDRVEFNLQLTREERDAFAVAFAAEEEERAELTAEEREVVRKASERIVKYLDESIARSKENREKMEKAVGEWYSRLSKGESWGGTDLLQLFRRAAAGEFDDLYRA